MSQSFSSHDVAVKYWNSFGQSKFVPLKNDIIDFVLSPSSASYNCLHTFVTNLNQAAHSNFRVNAHFIIKFMHTKIVVSENSNL